ncbi:MAG: MATE family efflux transporter [Halanaerobium sp.]|nr:MATE family efflux transporter [Halanaerobium sp.]
MTQSRRSTRLGEEPIAPLLIKLSLPSILAMAIQALYNVVDSIYVGHVSKDALTALSLTFPIQMILIAIAVGTGVGTSSLISRLLGRGEKEAAANAAEHVLIITVIYGIIIAAVVVPLAHQLINFFISDPHIVELAVNYIQIIMLGSLALFFPMISNNILRGQGNTLLPMVTMLIGAILNIILDPIFIFEKVNILGLHIKGLNLSVAGAATATVLSRFLSGLFIFFVLFSEKNELRLNFRQFKPDLSIVKSIYQVGLPAMVMQFLGSIMLAFMNKILADFNATAIAAGGIYFRLQSFILMPVFGLNQGYMPIVGYNYGHGNPNRMKKTMKYAFLVGFLFTTAGFALFQLFPRQLIAIFNNDPQLLQIGTTALKRISIAYPIIGPAIIASTTFQAMGRGIPSLVLSLTRQIIVLVPVMYFLGRLFGLSSIWYAFPISEFVNAIVAAVWLIAVLRQVFSRLDTQQERLEYSGE